MTEPEYYEVLGIARTATPEEIRRRFRTLARQFHPDVSADGKQSHERFIQISEAYQVLSDAGRRAAYDLALRDRERFRQAIAARQAQRQAASRPPTSARAPAPPAGPPPRPGPGAQAPTATPRQQVRLEQTLRAAEAAFRAGRLKDASHYCRTLLDMDRRYGPAYELLGDIYSRQRRVAQAVQMYSMAAQLTRANGLVMAKLNRLQAREGGATVSSRGDRNMDAARRALLRRHASQRFLIAVAGLGAVVGMVAAFGMGRLPPAPAGRLGWPIVPGWTDMLLCLLVISGWALGVTLALTGALRALDDEFFYPRAGRTRSLLPLGLLVAITGGLFYYLGAAIYLVAASVQECLSGSVLLVLGGSALLMGAFAGVAWLRLHDVEMAQQLLLVGGNVIFLSMLAGWFFGDIFRPLWA
jgi:curved DNA-binding protein CbpA